MKAANVLFSLMIALVLSTSCSVLKPGPKRVALFDGKTLNGWTLITCEAVVDDGDILLKSGNGLVQTEKKYGDFILEFDWKALREEKWDSGVYFRYDTIPPKRPWPRRYQINLRYDMAGNLDDLEGAKSEGLVKEAGQWNRFKLTVKGTKVSLEINGKPAWSADGLVEPEGYIGLQAEVPGGGQYRFKNIYITELN